MVPSSVITITADGERLTCGGFSLCKTIRLGNFEFIADYFGGLSLSPRRSESGTTFIGSTHSRTTSPRRAMIEDSTEEFDMVSSGVGGFSHPSPRSHITGALPTPITTTPWMENALATQVPTTVPPRMATPRPDIGLPSMQCYTRQGGQQAQARARQPTIEQEAVPR
jgi:hypothetical protein